LAHAADRNSGLPAQANGNAEGQSAAAASSTASGEWSPQFLDPHQNETLTVLAERIIPGSGRAQVNRTIDLLLTVDTQQNQGKFLESLSAFDAEGIQRHGQPFLRLTEEQQLAILTTASTAEAAPKEADGDWDPWSGSSSSGTASESHLTLRDHFDVVKEWVGKAYFSSEVGLRDLGWTGRVMWDSWPGCQHPDGHA
jgi:gluconate 2-dehydrogenase subunit 3-like protein